MLIMIYFPEALSNSLIIPPEGPTAVTHINNYPVEFKKKNR